MDIVQEIQFKIRLTQIYRCNLLTLVRILILIAQFIVNNRLILAIYVATWLDVNVQDLNLIICIKRCDFFFNLTDQELI